MPYSDLFFDLDHTLWDYDTSAMQTLDQLYDRYELSSKTSATKKDLHNAFFSVNENLWDKYNQGAISKFFLRTERFKLAFNELGVTEKLFDVDHITAFNKDYLNDCPRKPNLIQGAIDLLEILIDSFNLHIITNGFIEVQTVKIKESGLDKYFQYVITSEEAGAKKPYSQIFEFAMKKTNASPLSSIMIGDNLMTDIKGAREFGMDQIYFNPKQLTHHEEVTFEITDLEEVVNIVNI